MKDDAILDALDGVAGAAVVEPRRTGGAKANLSPHALHAAHHAMRIFHRLDGHEVRDFSNSVGGQKTGEQDIRVRQIELAMLGVLQLRCDPKTAAAFGIEQRGEEGGRVEVREAQKVDRPIQRDQRDGVQIADHAVVLDGLRFHGRTVESRCGAGEALSRKRKAPHGRGLSGIS